VRSSISANKSLGSLQNLHNYTSNIVQASILLEAGVAMVGQVCLLWTKTEDKHEIMFDVKNLTKTT
jgi:hypothetical protein